MTAATKSALLDLADLLHEAGWDEVSKKEETEPQEAVHEGQVIDSQWLHQIDGRLARIERLLAASSPVREKVDDLRPSDWESLDALLKILRVYESTTRALETSDSAYSQFEVLLPHHMMQREQFFMNRIATECRSGKVKMDRVEPGRVNKVLLAQFYRHLGVRLHQWIAPHDSEAPPSVAPIDATD